MKRTMIEDGAVGLDGSVGSRRRMPRAGVLVLFPWLAASALLMLLGGCASGSFSSSGSGTTSNGSTVSNPATLPPLTAATAVNDYIGTQVPGGSSSDSENLADLHLSQTDGSYSYANIAIPGPTENQLNSTGLYVFQDEFLNLVYTQTGRTKPNYYGFVIEDPSRYAFFVDAGLPVTAMVPKQASTCITPSAAITILYVTLPGESFLPDTDTAYGTVQLSASGTAFTFSQAQQFDESGAAATTGLIPFGAGSCGQSSANPELGYFVDTPASAANGNTEVRSFLGPTGILIQNLQASDLAGNPLPLPGVLGMIQSATSIDTSAVTSLVNTYRGVLINGQPYGSPQTSYGFWGESSPLVIPSDGDTLVSTVGITGLTGGWSTATASNLSGVEIGNAIVLGTQDTSHPGLFPQARLVEQYAGGSACPAGTQHYADAALALYCSYPATVIIGQHDGKYILLAAANDVIENNAPVVLILVQN